MITSLPQNQNADFILYLMSQDFSESQVIIVHFLLFKTRTRFRLQQLDRAVED